MEFESVYDGLYQIQHNEGSKSSPTCLRIPHILNQILQHFSNSELLRLSLLNKQWNYEARKVLKNRGTLDALLQPHHPCKSIAAFASHVRRMNVVPYSGLRIYFDHHAPEGPCSIEGLDSSIDVIFNRLQLKPFGIWSEVYPDCPAFILVEKILQDHPEVLESIDMGAHFNVEFIRQAIQHSTFPRLTTLKLEMVAEPWDWGAGASETALINEFISRAPKLQELHLNRLVDFHTDLLAGSAAVLVLDSEIDPLDSEGHDGLIGALRLRRMRLKYHEDFSMERFNRIVPVVLHTSCSTLQKVSLDSVFVPSLMHYGIRLENVTKLTICLDRQLEIGVPQHVAADVAAFWRILQDFNFTHIFPKVKKVKITSSFHLFPEQISEFVQGNFILPEPSPDRTINIETLRITNFKYSPINVPFLASMFPNIEKLSIKKQDGPVPPYWLIWEHWIHLKQLVVQDERVWRQNLDGLFCGLFPEEIDQLRDKDEEYLKAVNIVPVMPSIMCMRELRTFTLSDCGFGLYYGENDPEYVFSEVTALIAFSRCPNLSVTIKTTSKYENAWSHMKKYASIVIVK